jgi:hypothetical protein
LMLYLIGIFWLIKRGRKLRIEKEKANNGIDKQREPRRTTGSEPRGQPLKLERTTGSALE